MASYSDQIEVVRDSDTPVNAKKPPFAAKGDGVTDDAAALQAAIDFCIANQRKLLLPIGVYKIGVPLAIWKWSGTGFSACSLTMEGEKYTWSDEGALIKSTRIEPTFKDTFAIGIQNGRGVHIKDIVCVGLNTFDIGNGITAPACAEMMTNSTFVKNGARDSRYSPYSGICIDPFGTSAPADGGYPGFSDRYVASAAGSSGIVLEGVRCKNFTVGVMVTPNGTTQNAEDITFRHCSSIFNKVGVAIGQAQSRDVNWYAGNCAWNLYCFDGQTYGAQQGAAPKIYGCNMSGKYLFNVYSRGGNGLWATGIHAESFASLGFIGTGANTVVDPAYISGQFSFADFGGIYPDHHLVAYAPVRLEGGFSTQGMTYKGPVRIYHPKARVVKFDNAYFGIHALNEFWLAPTVGADAAPFVNLMFDDCAFNDGSTRGPATSVAVLSHMDVQLQASDIDRAVVPLGGVVRFVGGSALELVFNGGTQNSVSLGTVTVTPGANGTATFTVADGSIVRVGDLIYTSTSKSYEDYRGQTFASASNCLGIVSAVSSNDITISGWPQSLATGSYALTKKWWSRFHQASTGDTTSQSADIANVTNPTSWVAGNAIKGAGIPAGAFVTAVVSTTVTISKAATASATGVRLYDANMTLLTGTAV